MCYSLQATRQRGCTCCRSLDVGEVIDVEEQHMNSQKARAVKMASGYNGHPLLGKEDCDDPRHYVLIQEHALYVPD